MSAGDRNPPRPRALAVLGAFASKQEAIGGRPSDEELVALLEGSLPESRREEVLSHIASDPDKYKEWQLACEAHGSAAPSNFVPIHRFKRLKTLSWTISSLAAGVAAIAVGVLHLQRPDHVAWDRWPIESSSTVSRSGGESVSSRDRIRAGFLRGTLEGLIEADADRSLRHRLEAAVRLADICEPSASDGDCASGRDLGAFSVRAFVACARAAPLSKAALDTYLQEMDVLVNAYSDNPDAPDLAEQVSALRTALGASGTFGEIECQQLNTLILRVSTP